MIDSESETQELNPNSLKVLKAYGEPAVAEAMPGERFQFFRLGYYIADEKDSSAEKSGKKVFNKTVGLKSTWKK